MLSRAASSVDCALRVQALRQPRKSRSIKMTGHGGRRSGSGRPKGAVTKKTREVAIRAKAEGITPLEYMLQVLRDGSADPKDRMWAAEKAAPYVHARLASVEHQGKDGGPMVLEIVRFAKD